MRTISAVYQRTRANVARLLVSSARLTAMIVMAYVTAVIRVSLYSVPFQLHLTYFEPHIFKFLSAHGNL